MLWPLSIYRKKGFWDNLQKVIKSELALWVLLEDLNVITDPLKKLGGRDI